MGKAGLLLFTCMLLLALYSALFAGNAHRVPSGKALESPNSHHPLGTDDLGIDLLAQLAHGAGVSIFVGLGTALLAGIGGSILGIVAGHYGRWIDRFVMGICDMMIVIPHFPMMILFATYFGPSLKNIILVITLLSWTRPARIVRTRILSLQHENYIRAAKSYGAGFWHLTLRHFMPAVAPIVTVNALRIISHAIIAEAGLSFLGLGDPLSKSWGVILNRSINFSGIYFTDYWKWWLISPLTCLILLVLSIAFISRDLESLFNHTIKQGNP
jgi:peptide/nickel transport system permease protein